jgi:hypothetical protein
MRDEEESGETPAELRERAEGLRECARQARTLAGALGPYVDDEATRASGTDPVIWQGPYAEATTQVLVDRKSTLNSMADALMNDASRWESEAADLDDRAGRSEEGN